MFPFSPICKFNSLQVFHEIFFSFVAKFPVFKLEKWGFGSKASLVVEIEGAIVCWCLKNLDRVALLSSHRVCRCAPFGPK